MVYYLKFCLIDDNKFVCNVVRSKIKIVSEVFEIINIWSIVFIVFNIKYILYEIY